MKLKIFFSVIVFLNTIFAFAQNRVTIAGTKCSMVPPVKFVPATAFSGFQNNALGASIMINEIPAPLSVVLPGFTAEALQAKGMTLLKKDTVDFNGGTALYIQLSQPANGTIYFKQLLVFEEFNKTVMVNGIYPQENKSIAAEVKKAIFTTLYSNAQADDGLSAASFSIDVAGTEFKFIQYLAGSLLYSADGKMPTDAATLIAGSSISKIDITDKKQFCINRLKQLPRGETNEIKSINPVTINNLTGYEIFAEGKGKNDQPELVYQAIVFAGADYYIIIGTTSTDFEKYKAVFKTVAKTFKQK